MARPPKREQKSLAEQLDAGERQQSRVIRAQAAILKAALKVGVQVNFGEGRRASDVALALLKGERGAVLALPPKLEDELEFDLQVMRSTFDRDSFELTLILIEPIDDQAVQYPERRAALRRRLEELAADPEGEGLLEYDSPSDEET